MKSFKKIKLGRNNNIFFKKSKKFKSVEISVTYKMKYDHKNVSAFKILAKYLGNCNKNYPSIEKLNTYIESLYGTLVGMKSNFCGSLFTFTIYANYINDKYLDETDLANKVIELLHNLIYEPLLVEGLLDETIFDICKENCLIEVDSLKEYNMAYVVRTLQQKLIDDKNSSFVVSKHGQEDILKKLNNKNILKYYKRILNAPFDICVAGDFSYSKMEGLIRKYYQNKKSRNFDYTIFGKIKNERFQPISIVKDVSQAKVAIAYNIPILFNDPRHYAFRVARLILSGTLSSKFGKNIREKLGLCYSISSSYSSYYGCFIVTTGVSSENVERVVKEVDNQILQVKNGNITTEEINRAKEALITSLRSMDDTLSGVLSMIDIYQKFGQTFILEDEINKYSNISKKEIIEVANLLSYCGFVVLDKENLC